MAPVPALFFWRDAMTNHSNAHAEDYPRELNPRVRLIVYGQELNDETYAICKSDMMIKGQNAKNIHPGNSFTEDGLPDEQQQRVLAVLAVQDNTQTYKNRDVFAGSQTLLQRRG